MNQNHKKTKRGRIIALLTREELEFVEKLSMDSIFSTGHKLSRVGIISALVDAAMELGIDAQGVHNKKELVQRILNGLHKKERRGYPRLDRHLIVHFRKMDSLEKYEQTATTDASLGGFRVDVVHIGKPLSVNELVEISISTPAEKDIPVKAIGRVAWVREKAGGHKRELGIALTYIKEADRERYFKYLIRDSALLNYGGK